MSVIEINGKTFLNLFIIFIISLRGGACLFGCCCILFYFLFFIFLGFFGGEVGIT